MTNKVYRSAMGKTVDLGTIMLKNEHVRAVGNMKVNARGDKLDNANQVVETRAERIQKQNNSTSTNVSHAPVQTSSRKNRPDTSAPEPVIEEPVIDDEIINDVADNEPVALAPEPNDSLSVTPLPENTKPIFPTPPEIDLKNPVRPPKSPAADQPVDDVQSAQGGGLAGAIARSREIKQDLDKTRRQKAQDTGVRKI